MIKSLDIRSILDKAVDAAERFKLLNQKQTDDITRAVYQAGFDNRVALAKMATAETRLGIWKDKVI